MTPLSEPTPRPPGEARRPEWEEVPYDPDIGIVSDEQEVPEPDVAGNLPAVRESAHLAVPDHEILEEIRVGTAPESGADEPGAQDLVREALAGPEADVLRGALAASLSQYPLGLLLRGTRGVAAIFGEGFVLTRLVDRLYGGVVESMMGIYRMQETANARALALLPDMDNAALEADLRANMLLLARHLGNGGSSRTSRAFRHGREGASRVPRFDPQQGQPERGP